MEKSESKFELCYGKIQTYYGQDNQKLHYMDTQSPIQSRIPETGSKIGHMEDFPKNVVTGIFVN